MHVCILYIFTTYASCLMPQHQPLKSGRSEQRERKSARENVTGREKTEFTVVSVNNLKRN